MIKNWIRKLNKKRFDAFTLLEMLIVLTIIGILMAIGIGSYSSIINKAKKTQATSTMKAIGIKAYIYQSNNNQYPKSVMDIQKEGLISTKDTKDPWEQEFKLAYSTNPGGGTRMTIISAGPDKKFDTEDDIKEDIEF